MSTNPIFGRLILALVLILSSSAMPADIFPGQPRISAAYNKVTAASAELDKASREGIGNHVKNALSRLEEAETQLELVAKNKGSAPGAAKKLVIKAKEALSGTSVTKDHLATATSLCKDALKKIVQAGESQQ